MTEEDIWKGDLLGRKEEGKYLQRYIENLYNLNKKDQTSFVLNINSEWGHGKTWFLERFSKQLEVNFPVVYFDAWKNDFTKDPLMSFVSVVCEELANRFAGDRTAVQQVMAIKDAAIKFIKPSIPVILAALVKHYTGLNFEQLGGTKKDQKKLEDISDVISEITKISSSEAMNSFIKEKNAIEEFTATLEALVNKIASGKSKTNLHLPICIIVDELDRCRPTYAIELLEMVKHLFSVKGIFFILATDTKQLAHSIRAVYGQGFNSPAYLKRFFYAEYVLAEPDYDQISKYLFDQSPRLCDFLFLPESLHGKYGFNGFFSKISSAFKLSVRDQEHVFQILENIVISSNKKDYHFIFLFFLICLKHKYSDACIHQSLHKNLTQIREFFKTMAVEGIFSNVLFESDYRSEYELKKESLNVKNLIEYYFELLDGEMSNSNLNSSPSEIWKQEITVKLTKGATRDRRGNFVGNHDLPEYFDYVDRFGKGRLVMAG